MNLWTSLCLVVLRLSTRSFPAGAGANLLTLHIGCMHIYTHGSLMFLQHGQILRWTGNA
jgi:hypothetical protein